MNAAILHLSDLHLKDNTIIEPKKIESIRGALGSWKSEFGDLKHCFIIISGDIAWSGKSCEYKMAIDFLADLEGQIKAPLQFEQVAYIVVPGNHDCNFKLATPLRGCVIEHMKKTGSILTDNETIDLLTSVQKDYFDFQASVSSRPLLAGREKLYYEECFDLNEYKIKFRCYNTAWMSELSADQGQLAFPLDLIPKPSEDSAVVCAVFHHPYNWFEANNGREFKKHIINCSDIVLTGHEHDPYIYTVSGIKGEFNEYMEGGVLHAPDSSHSSFNCQIVNLKDEVTKRLQCSWDGKLYSTIHASGWDPLVKNKSLTGGFKISPEFRGQLDDLGIAFSHRRKNQLRLSDVFIYPQLKETRLSNKKNEVPYYTISSEKVIEFVKGNNRLVIVGANRAGKTCLLKAVYSDFTNEGYAPVLIDGATISSAKSEKITQLLYDSFCKQYSAESLEEYKQFPFEKKCILIDDFDKSSLNQQGKAAFLDSLQSLSDRIVIAGTDLVEFEEFISEGGRATLSYTRCEISELGYELRYKLIEKWVSLGQEHTVDPLALENSVKFNESMINALMSTKLLPSNPFVILAILQTIDASIPLDTISGAYGQLYEIIITGVLAKASNGAHDLRAKNNFLSEMAYQMFKSREHSISEDRIREIDNIFFDKRDIRTHPLRWIDELVSVDILSCRNRQYSFKYPYLFHFYVGRYISQNLRNSSEETDMRAQLDLMSRNVFRDEYANIIIFLCHLSKDPLIHDSILSNAQVILKEVPPCSLTKDISFITDSHPQEPEVVISDHIPGETRLEMRKARDQMEEQVGEPKTELEIKDVETIDELNPILQLNLAFKTIQIMGQILRDFPSDYGKEEKQKLAEECYALGLRSLGFLIGIIRENLEDIRHDLGNIIRERKGIDDKLQIVDWVDKLLFMIILSFSFGIIKRISLAAGSEELQETYKRLLGTSPEPSVSLIDLSIKLDHFRDIPQEEIKRLYKSFEGNPLSLTLLRFLVIDNMFMYRWAFHVRQGTLAVLQIKSQDPRMIESAAKKLPRENK